MASQVTLSGRAPVICQPELHLLMGLRLGHGCVRQQTAFVHFDCHNCISLYACPGRVGGTV